MKLSGLDVNHVVIEEKDRLSKGFLDVWRYRLRHQLFDGQTSSQLVREAVLRSPSVGVLLYDPVQAAVVLVEQFRIGPFLANDDPWLLEIVAGMSEAGESLDDVAYREVSEETSCQVKKLIPVMDFYLSPGGSNEKMQLYCGLVDSRNKEGFFGNKEEGEDIKVHVIPFETAYKMTTDGRIANAAAVIVIQWLKLNFREIEKDVKT